MIRSRVERLASVCLPSPEPLIIIIHEQFRHARCPSCRTDVEAHAKALALSAARAERARGVVRVFAHVDEPTICPRCATPLL
jgi:NAD-dependent SIR2 family protein deacetylase